MSRGAPALSQLIRGVAAIGLALLATTVAAVPARASDTLLATSAVPSTSAPTATPASTGNPGSKRQSPSVGLVVKEVAIGSTVSLRLGGFTAKVLTIQVCGNEGRRGSVDCNVADAQPVDVPNAASAFLADFVVTKPPVPCPCIVQVASERFDEVAVAAFTLLGHPIAPVVENGTGSIPLQLSIVADPVDGGLWGRARTSLAGATWYDVTVIVQNTSASAVEGTALAVEVGRGTDDVIREVAFPKVGALAPRGTWRETVRLRMTSPVYGTFLWRATTTAFGLSTTATTTTKSQPTLLVVLVLVLAVVVLTLLVRLVTRLGRWLVRRRGRLVRNTRGAAS